MKNDQKERSQDEIALERYKIISPILTAHDFRAKSARKRRDETAPPVSSGL